jgi:hypothetical protein
MSSTVRRPGSSPAARLGTGLAAGGGICIVASMLIAFVVADHSSSDSSPSSLAAIGVGTIGVALAVLGAAVRAVVSLAWLLWQRVRRSPLGGFGSSQL